MRPAPPTSPLPLPEFIALIAMLFATIAFTIDAMLPALPEIAAELTPDNPNRAQLIITSFVLGMGAGTFLAGPLSDAWGRKPVIMGGAALYCAGTLIAWAAPTLEGVLAGRMLQGLGAAAPRIVSLALLRDLYSGRQMARIMSFAMMVFTLVPAVAPLAGAAIIAVSGWRGIFAAFLVFAAISITWLGLRQPETLPRAGRRPLNGAALTEALREVLRHPVVRSAIMVQSMVFAALFATLSSIQQVFDLTFGLAREFPVWFALIALTAGSASLLNAALVVRLGMRRMVRTSLAVQVAASALMAAATFAGVWTGQTAFPAFLVWVTGVFFMAGLTLGNVNAIAMEPMGHIAGMAASAVAALATVASVVIAVPIGLSFDGTPAPLMAGVALTCAAGLWLMRRLPG